MGIHRKNKLNFFFEAMKIPELFGLDIVCSAVLRKVSSTLSCYVFRSPNKHFF